MIAAVGGLAAVTERISAIESRVAAFRPEPLVMQRTNDGGAAAPVIPPGALGSGSATATGAGASGAGLAGAAGVMDIAQSLSGGDFGAVFGALEQTLGMPSAVARPGSGVPGGGAWGGGPWSAQSIQGINGPAPVWGGPDAIGGDYDVCPDCAGKHRGAGGLPPGTPFVDLFAAAGERWGIPPQVLAAVGYVESRFQTDAVSSAGAQGVMQFLPSTAAAFGVDPWDPESAIDGAARYLRELQDRFGSLDLALASYNVGQGTISRAGGIQPGSQGERYVGYVRQAMEQFA